jgi:nitrogenase molybdenum-iron protein alpha/beta subunit
MLRDFRDSHKDLRAKIINVASAGYAGTQFEGFFRALRALVEQTEMDAAPNDKVNIITGMISPADTRFIKELLEKMGLDAILLPDISETLDGGHETAYSRLPLSGTPIGDVAKMAGARFSIEISAFIEDEYSPALYLRERYGVPMARCPLPVGLRDTDRFIELLEQAGGVAGDEIQKQRSRLLDAMADSHKYNAQVRAAVFGEPDLVYSVSRMLVENGAMPVLAATAQVCADLPKALTSEFEDAAAFHLDEMCAAIDACDFDDIERYAVELKANVLIGSSDGRRIEEKRRIPLVRCAFPVHDHVGGQRIRILGYEGGLSLLDRITNSLIGRIESGFRSELYELYYRNNATDPGRRSAARAPQHGPRCVERG